MSIVAWLKHYFAPSHFETLPPLVATTRLVLLILLITAFLLMADDVINGYGGNIEIYLFLALSTTGALALTFCGYFLLPRLFIPFVVLGIVTYAIFKNEMGLHDYAMQSYPAVIILSGLLLGKRAPLLFAGLCILMIIGLCHAEVTGFMPSKLREFADYIDIISIIIILGVTGVVMRVLMNALTSSTDRARRNEAQLRKANQQLQARTRQLESQRHALRENEEHLRAALQEKEVLLKEIHHRVKNNLQVVSSLLNLQSSLLRNDQDRLLFQESRQRIRTMALIHERLYQSDNLSRIDFSEYLKTLVHELTSSYTTASASIEVTLDLAEVQLGINTAIPCGLIVNELVSNALKYAFLERNGTIVIRFHRSSENQHLLEIQDDGVGMPQDLDIDQLDSLGLQLVKGLVEEQLDGTLTWESLRGTTWRITFPATPSQGEQHGTD